MYKSVLSGTFEFPSRPGPPCAKITEVSPVEINSRAMGPNKPEAGAKSMTDVPAQPKPVPAAGTADRCQRHDLLVKIGDLASLLSFWRVRLVAASGSKFNHVRKNNNQTRPRRVTARAVLITNSKSTDGPGSACRASVGVSMIIPCFLVTIERSQISVRHPPGQTPAFFLYHPA
jgi:hypothetical protein